MYSIANLSSLIHIEIYTHLGQVWHKAKAAVSLKCILKPTCAYTGSTFGFLACCSPVRYLEIPAKAQNSQILLEKNCWNWMNTMQGQQEDMGILTSIGLWTRKHSFRGIKISDLVSLLWCFKYLALLGLMAIYSTNSQYAMYFFNYVPLHIKATLSWELNQHI